MEYCSVAQKAKEWNISERSVRNYCALGRIEGAKLEGKTWKIPDNAVQPKRKNSKTYNRNLLEVLKDEKAQGIKGGIYHKIQIELTYNSNHIEGSQLTHEQTRYIYETNTIGFDKKALKVDDIIETANHFRCIDFVIDQARQPLSEIFIKKLHEILKNGTSDSRKSWFAVGSYKKLPNEVGGQETTKPEEVVCQIKQLIANYNTKQEVKLEDIIAFHHDFEIIHPFQDGNGRIGRLIILKECLKYNIVPFIITDDIKM
ncbi:MAG: Fic family protein, partial [Sphaerochaetaceae bacterium]|nr:Fic family protein [Sphaerochaetaceae bacterium]